MLERSHVRMKVKGRKVKRPKQFKKLRRKKMSANTALKISNSKRRKR